MPPPSHLNSDIVEPVATTRGYRKELLILLPFLLLAGAGLYVLSSSSASMAGTYLLAGGQGYMHVEETPAGAKVNHFQWSKLTGSYGIRRLRGLWLQSESSAPRVTRIHLVPSAGRAGDYDLMGIDHVTSGRNWYDPILFRFRRLWSRPPAFVGTPVPSFFHKVDDPGVLQYMRLADSDSRSAAFGLVSGPMTTATLFAPSRHGPQLLALARTMVSRSPEDPYLNLLLMDALLRSAEPEELQQLLDKWNHRFEQLAPRDPMPMAVFPLIQQKAEGLIAARKGLNAYGAVLTLFARSTDYDSTMRIFGDFARFEALSYPGGYVLPTSDVVNSLEADIRARIANTQAVLSLLDGNASESIRLVLGSYRFGQLLQNLDTHLSTKRIATGVRTHSSQTIIFLAANAPLTTEQCFMLGEHLNRFAADERLSAQVNFVELGLPSPVPVPAGSRRPLYDEAARRHDVSYAQFQVARAITAARHVLLTTGKLPDPAAGTRMPPLLPDGLAIDPFSPTSAPLQMLLNTTSNTLMVYSVGPDQIDDGATVEYDPSSKAGPGDILAELPAVGVYPFTPGGVTFETTAALHASFSSGLPPDSFRSFRLTKPLQSVETTGSVLVYSVGPDRRSEQYSAGTAVQYDVTNGLMSAGDLITTVSD